mmetsp:Transcript_32802/g.71608  ORF Transcript_32802/g.71608 Transcript_32802/m.71608 type:complete len:453 (+) Transcript_32802:29-1387(+)
MPSPLVRTCPLLAAGWLSRTSVLLNSVTGVTEATAASQPLSVVLDRIRGAYFGALVADALSLGSHYEYDAQNIWNAYGGKSIQRYYDPGEGLGGSTHGVGWGRRNYHPGQKRGDGTDYGLYTQLALEYFSTYEADDEASTTASSGESKAVRHPDKLISLWRERVEGPGWGAWKCTQTRQALQKVASVGDPTKITEQLFRALGGPSNAVALRSAAVFGVYEDEEEAARASTRLMFTHANREALEGGEFLTRAAHRIVYRSDPATPAQDPLPIKALIKLFKGVAADMRSAFLQEQVRKAVTKFSEVTDPNSALSKERTANEGRNAHLEDDRAVTSMARLWDVGKSEPIKVGKASPTEGVLPSTLYFVLKYWDQALRKGGEESAFSLGARANVMVGGDSASRAVCVGMLLGALCGEKCIPRDLQEGLRAWKKSEEMLQKLPVVRKLRAAEKKHEL